MSKYEYGVFHGDYMCFTANKEKFTKEQALKIAKFELDMTNGTVIVGSAYVRHRAGVDEDCRPCVGWWLEFQPAGRCCDVWLIIPYIVKMYYPKSFETFERVKLEEAFHA